jgi:phosphatidylglycerol lysyltransferase
MPMPVPKLLNLSLISTRPLGITCLLLISGYVSLNLLRKKPFTFRKLKITVPSIQAVLVQISVSSLNWMIAGTALYLLLPSQYGLSWDWFMGAYLLSQLMGISSQVPGGIGVFEASMLLLLPSEIPNSVAFGALVVFRGIYTILPLILTSLLMGSHEIRAFIRLRKSMNAPRDPGVGVSPDSHSMSSNIDNCCP